jgi:hypothetical protein
MGNKTVLAKKKRGPPPTGKGIQVVVRMQPAPLSALDAWATKQKDQPTRAEAIRRLVELGLAGTKKFAAASQQTAAMAKKLAAEQIDRMGDPAAPSEEQASRKRRLLKGPEEFRDARVDRPKAKGK